MKALKLLLAILLFTVASCNKRNAVLENMGQKIITLSQQMKMQMTLHQNDPDKFVEITTKFQNDVLKLLTDAMAKTDGDERKMLQLLKNIIVDVKVEEDKFVKVSDKYDAEFKLDFVNVKSVKDLDHNDALLAEFKTTLNAYSKFYKELGGKIRSDSKLLSSSKELRGFSTGMVQAMQKKIPQINKVTSAFSKLLVVQTELNAFFRKHFGKVTFEGDQVLFEKDEDVNAYNAILEKMGNAGQKLVNVSQQFIQNTIR